MNITREHLDTDNYYIGPDVSNYDGDIELEAGLGVVKFKNKISVSGSIIAKPGTGIKSSGYIEADGSIRSNTSIEAGGSIRSGWDICAGKSIFAGRAIDADGLIEAGDTIKAGGGIRAGYSISCKTLSADLPIFAGTAIWGMARKEDAQIRCERLHGKVAYGKLVTTATVEEGNKMKCNGKFSATWVYENIEDTFYLVPVSVADIFEAYCGHPVIASVSGHSLRKSVNVLGVAVWEFDHLEDKSGHYLNIAKSEAIEALRRWGIEVEDVDC